MNLIRQYRIKPLITLALFLILAFSAVHFFTVRTQSTASAITNVSPTAQVVYPIKDTTAQPAFTADTLADKIETATEQLSVSGTTINTGKVSPDELMKFAETLIGIPYVWGSTDPAVGFDCSGFITYVFNHFNIAVPRSSIDFFNVGKTIPVEDAKRGDFILFTGTDPLEKNIGHMGLVVSNGTLDGLEFIHATSGRASSVTISKLNEHYMKRFVRISRIFNQNK